MHLAHHGAHPGNPNHQSFPKIDVGLALTALCPYTWPRENGISCPFGVLCPVYSRFWSNLRPIPVMRPIVVLLLFPCFAGIFACFGLLEPKFTICPSRPPEWPFKHYVSMRKIPLKQGEMPKGQMLPSSRMYPPHLLRRPPPLPPEPKTKISETAALSLPLGRGVCETKFKKGRARDRKPFIHRVCSAQRGIEPFIHRVCSAQRGIETMVSDHGLGKGQTMG